MAENERVLGVIYDAEGQVGRLALPKMYDLVFTNQRVVGAVTVKTGGARVLGQALGGVLGQMAAAAIAKSGSADRRLSKYAGVPLDNVVAQDDANFAAPYAEIENPKVSGLFSKTLQMKVNGKKAFFRLPKEQVPAARALVAQNLRGAKV